MKNNITAIATLISTASMAGLFSSHAHGQNSNASLVLEEVIVTAQKRETTLLDTPISITAISGERLKSLSAVTLDDVTNIVPGVIFTNDSGLTNSNLVIRGVSNFQESPSIDLANSIYVDEVFIGSAMGSQLSLFDLAQVEVLRGPQGTLFGRNSVGGAINIQTKNPSEKFGFNADISAGDYNYTRFDVGVDAPLIDGKLLSRFAFSKVDRDGYMENQLEGQPDLNETGRTSARAKLLFMPSDNTTMLLSADYSKVDQKSRGFDALEDSFGIDNDGFDRKVSVLVPDGEKYDGYSTSLNITHSTGQLTFTSISAFRHYEYERTENGTATPFSIATVNVPEKSDIFSQELRVSYVPNDQIDLVAGVYYYKRDLDFDGILTLGTAVPARLRGLSQDRSVETRANSFSVFAHGIYHFNENLRLSAGVRHTREEKDMDLILGGPLRSPASSGRRSYSDTWEKLTPSINLQYSFSDSSNAYITYSTGFKSGGFNELAFLDDANQAYQEEDVNNFEIGSKGSFASGRGRYSAALYLMTWEELQIERISIDPVTNVFSTYVGNIGEAQTHGADIELDYLVSSNLTINASAALNKSEVTEGGGDINKGNTLSDAPEFSANLSFNYTATLTNTLNWYLGGSASWTDEYYASSIENIDVSLQDSHTIISSQFGIKSSDGKYNVYLWGKNLTDEAVIQRVLDLRDSSLARRVLASINAPRTFGITFSINL